MTRSPGSGSNLTPTSSHVSHDERARRFGHRPMTLWFTGLSGSGKSTLAYAAEAHLLARGVHASVVDGDNVRHGLNADLGFSPDDRTENIRRVAHLCRLMNDAGLIVLASFISPYRRDRQSARAVHRPNTFAEVHVSTPLEECERRDCKGLYARARRGEIPEFSGVSAPYEPPDDPELAVDTTRQTVDGCVDQIVGFLERSGALRV